MADKIPLTPEIVNTLIDKITKFSETIGEFKFYPYQIDFSKRITRSLLLNEGVSLTALFARQSGKSHTVAATMAANMELLPFLAQKYGGLEMYEKGFWVGIFAPVSEQAETMFGKIYDIITTETGKEILTGELRMPIPARGGGRGNIIKLMNGSLARMHSANRRAKINSKTYHVILLDEVQDVEHFVVSTCLAEGSKVWLPDGRIVPIEQVVQEKLDVITLDGPKSPIEFYDNGEQDVWKITTNLGKTIEATSNHRFLVRRRVGSRQPKIDTVSNLKVGDTIAAPLEASYFGRKWSYNEGLLTGLLLGDGCLVANPPYFCGFKNTIDKLDEILPLGSKIGTLKYDSSTNSGLMRCSLISEIKSKNNNSNPVKKLMSEMGLWGHKGHTKFIPEGGSKEFLRGIVEGLIETDGCIHVSPTKKQISFASISERLVKELQETLLRFGIHGSVTTRKQNGKLGKTPYDLWHLVIKDAHSCCKFYEEFKIISKQEQLNTLYQIKSQKSSRLQAKDCRRKHDNRLTFERIKSIEYIGVKPTYCVNLNDNMFLVNGLYTFNSIGPMGAATNATLILTGTPAPVIGFFYDQINFNKSKDVKTNTLQQTHFEADCNIVKKYNPMYSKYIEKESKRLSPDSDEFLMSYMLIWPISKGMMFTKTLLEEKCYRRDLGIVTTYKKTPCVAGLDIGKSLDSTILTILKQDYSKVDEEGNMEKTILDWLVIEGDEWENQYPQIVDKLNDYWIETLIVDSTGVGDPVRERIAFMVPEIVVAPFVFSPSTKDTMYKYLDKEIRAGRLLIPYDSAARKTKKFRMFEHQMCSLMKNYSGKFLNPGPVDKSKGHDDACDSLGLAVYSTFFDCMPTVEEDDFGVFSNNRMNYSIFGSRYSRPRRI